MSNKAIIQFDEFSISLATLRKLPADRVAAFSALSFAVTEVNVLRRVFLSQAHDYIGEKLIDEAINSQKLVVLRTWSSKLFEAREFLEQLCKRKSKIKDSDLLSLSQDALVEFNKSTTTEGYQIARDIRHEVANHYSFDVAKKNLPHVHSDALCNFYIHQHGGNDYFPLGEAVMFHGRLHRKWSSLLDLEERRSKLDHWFEWCQDATSALSQSHAKFAEKLIFEPLGRNTFRQRTYWVPPSLVGHPFDCLTPVIFREDLAP